MFFNKYLKGPFMAFANAHIIDYPTPSNLNYLWSFGSMSGGVLIIQIVSGILVSMHYTPHIDLAFLSIEFFMRQIDFGWLIRYCHANGASMFFITIYLHIARGVFYCSYSYPRGQLWVSGVLIFILVMATSFMGYVLPWGQMSFWGVTVITNFFSIIPFAGTNIVEWIWGGFTIKNPTLNRIFSLHFVMPFILTAVTVLHLSLLHRDGSNNPLGCEGHYSVVGFYPYFYSKDLFAFSFFLTIFSSFVLFAPNFLGHNSNYIIADPYHTPKHIVPEWYFLPFYAILRAIPDKTGGIVGMGSAIVMLLVFPLVDFAETRSPVFRPLYKFFVMFFLSNFILLGHLGRTKTDWPYLEASRCSTFYYFFFLIVLVFSLGLTENFLAKEVGDKGFLTFIQRLRSIRSVKTGIKTNIAGFLSGPEVAQTIFWTRIAFILVKARIIVFFSDPIVTVLCFVIYYQIVFIMLLKKGTLILVQAKITSLFSDPIGLLLCLLIYYLILFIILLKKKS